ncbi:MAG: sigma-70 family RNA polymerase sigma factor [Burkholderiales bacterium]
MRTPPVAADDALAPGAADDARHVELIERIIARDEHALTALYDETVARVWSVVWRHTQNSALTEEVIGDVYWQAWRQAPRFDPARGRPLAWLLAMARSRAVDARRTEQRLRHASIEELDDIAAAADPAPGPPESFSVALEARRLHEALARLEARQRELVVLAFFSGLTHDEIAHRTALPLGTVKSRIRRAMATLRCRLGDGATARTGATV